MTVSLISAMSKNRVIGKDGTLPWNVPEDMKFFMRTTQGHAVIMGRKTLDSMGGKPLPRRRNIVVSRNADLRREGVEIAPSVEEAVRLALATDPEPFVIGGEAIYREALPLAQRMYITYVPLVVAEGDAFFPDFPTEGQDAWREVARRHGETEGVEFVTYER